MNFELKSQTSRYFINPFFDNPKAGAKLVTESWLKTQIRSLAEQIAKREISTEEYDKEGPYVGPSGIAYALNRLTKANIGFDYTKKVNKILEESSTANSIKKTFNSNKCRYLTGRFGFYSIKYLTESINSDSFNKKVNKLIDTILNEEVDNEILNGRTGFLAAFLMLRLEEVKEKVISDDQIGQILNVMLEEGRSYSEVHNSDANLMYVWHEKEYLGAAHGLSGILQIFLNYWEFLDAKGKEDVKQTVDWFLTIQLKDGNFPSNAAKIGKEAELVHWCHGATGALHMLISAHLIFGKEKYLEAAKRCAKLIWLKGILIKGPGICHGVAGSGYGFLLLYRHTKEEEWLDKAKAFSFIVMSKIFEQKARTPDHPWSLFEGWSGTLCFLIDLLQPLKAQFPMVPILFNN